MDNNEVWLECDGVRYDDINFGYFCGDIEVRLDVRLNDAACKEFDLHFFGNTIELGMAYDIIVSEIIEYTILRFRS